MVGVPSHQLRWLIVNDLFDLGKHHNYTLHRFKDFIGPITEHLYGKELDKRGRKCTDLLKIWGKREKLRL